VLALVPDNTGIVLGGYLFDQLAYAEDINRLNEKIEEIQASANAIDEAASCLGMKINASKTKVMRVTRHVETNPPSPKSLFGARKSNGPTDLFT
jgi:hypothetical protein